MLESLKFAEPYELTLLALGLGVLALATLLHRFDGRPFSFPILALLLGFVACALPLGLPTSDPHRHGVLALHLTELGVIVSLMGVGLKIDRPLGLAGWSSVWRLLLICMPLTIVAVAGLGWWWCGLSPAAAVLLGAALAPTDPVLASDVQVGEPDVPAEECGDEDDGEEEFSPGEEPDEVRFALTAEAGLNDSLAFPFTWAAVGMFTLGAAPAEWAGTWVAVDVGYRIVVGIVVGLLLGRGLAVLLTRLPLKTESDEMRAGLGALAATLLAYALTECLAGYGFLAVFITGLAIRHAERNNEMQLSLHALAEQMEQLFLTAILVALGGAVAGGLFDALTLPAAGVVLLLLLVVRPLAVWVSLIGERKLFTVDRLVIGFFGVRGIGSLFYLAFALEQAAFDSAELLWATCGLAVVLSVVIHGITAAPVMRYRERLGAPPQ